MRPSTAPSREEILQQALALDPVDRAYVVDELERSLPTTTFTSEDVSAAWTSEIDRRLNAYDRGNVGAVDLDSVLDQARKTLADHRSRRANP